MKRWRSGSDVQVENIDPERDTYDTVLGVVRVEVDTANVHGCISGRSRDNDLLGTTLQVSRSFVNSGEDTLWNPSEHKAKRAEDLK
jgi:hypothetical protein